MESDDWVKFGWVLWSGRKDERQNLVMNFYQEAWKKNYNTDAVLNEDGSPANFLRDAQYTCRKPVPWLAALLEEDPKSSEPPPPPQQQQQPRARPQEPGPSTSAVELPDSPGPQPAPSPSPGPSNAPFLGPSSPFEPLAAGLDHSPASDFVDGELASLLRKSSPKIENGGSFPMIVGSFFPGFTKYLANPTKPRLRVVFPLIPQYRIEVKNQMCTPYISCMDLSQVDVDYFNSVDPECLYLSDEQRNCEPGQVRYFCSSWVSLTVFYCL